MILTKRLTQAFSSGKVSSSRSIVSIKHSLLLLNSEILTIITMTMTITVSVIIAAIRCTVEWGDWLWWRWSRVRLVLVISANMIMMVQVVKIGIVVLVVRVSEIAALKRVCRNNQRFFHILLMYYSITREWHWRAKVMMMARQQVVDTFTRRIVTVFEVVILRVTLTIVRLALFCVVFMKDVVLKGLKLL